MESREADLETFRAWLAARPAPGSLQEQRTRFEAEHGAIPLPEGCEVAEIRAGSVVIEHIAPRDSERGKALVYLHGGGHMFGSARSHRHLVARLAAAAGVSAFSVGYRLAPEHPFPAGIEDARTAYDFLLQRGFSPDDLVVGGESAGGNLAAALVIKLRQDDVALPAGLYLSSPWLDMTCTGASYAFEAGRDPMVTRAALLACADAYLAGASPHNPLASPLMADLSGLPPMLIQASSDEVLLSDAVRFAEKAAMAGGDVELQLRPHVVHAWPLFHAQIRAGLDAIDHAGRWLAARLGENT